MGEKDLFGETNGNGGNYLGIHEATFCYRGAEKGTVFFYCGENIWGKEGLKKVIQGAKWIYHVVEVSCHR